MRIGIRAVCPLVLGSLSAPMYGAIISIGPFVGEKSENLENVVPPPGRIAERIDVFEGDVTFVSLVGDTTIHLWAGSCLNNNCARPRSGRFLIGATTKYAIEFNVPVLEFGSYFTNNSLADDFNARFFDADGNFLEEIAVDLPWRDEDWHWRGWSSDIPIGKMEIRSNGVLEGFIWLDDLEINQAVEAPCVRDPAWQCDGDVDGDGQVNPVDSGLVQAAFGSADEQDVCNYDLDCDGQINPVDSGIVQSLFGTCDAPRETCP